MNPVSTRTRVLMADHYKRIGRQPTTAHPPPLVIWLSDGCPRKGRCGLLRAFLHSDGWEVIGKDFRVHPEEGVKRWSEANGADFTLQDYNDGNLMIPDPRNIRGLRMSLPRDLSLWPGKGTILVGCDHGNTRADFDLLRTDCETVMRTRKETRRKLNVRQDPVS